MSSPEENLSKSGYQQRPCDVSATTRGRLMAMRNRSSSKISSLQVLCPGAILFMFSSPTTVILNSIVISMDAAMFMAHPFSDTPCLGCDGRLISLSGSEHLGIRQICLISPCWGGGQADLPVPNIQYEVTTVRLNFAKTQLFLMIF